MALTNVQRLTRGDAKYAAKRQAKNVAEVKFDPQSRNEYLLGFHKRKLARQADGRRKAEELNRQIRLAERKKLREERTKIIAKGMERLKEATDIIEGRANCAVDRTAEKPATNDHIFGKDKDDKNDIRNDDDNEGVDEEEEEFTGFADNWGILKRKSVNYGDSNVTIEEINLDPYVDINRSQEVLDEATRKAHEYAAYVNMLEKSQTKSQTKSQKPKKKKKFRYQTKT